MTRGPWRLLFSASSFRHQTRSKWQAGNARYRKEGASNQLDDTTEWIVADPIGLRNATDCPKSLFYLHLEQNRRRLVIQGIVVATTNIRHSPAMLKDFQMDLNHILFAA